MNRAAQRLLDQMPARGGDMSNHPLNEREELIAFLQILDGHKRYTDEN